MIISRCIHPSKNELIYNSISYHIIVIIIIITIIIIIIIIVITMHCGSSQVSCGNFFGVLTVGSPVELHDSPRTPQAEVRTWCPRVYTTPRTWRRIHSQASIEWEPTSLPRILIIY